MHSGSTAFALMFVDRFKTKFSISDNGVGFATSMKLKEATNYYIPDQLKKRLIEMNSLPNISSEVLDNLFTIFETLFYSSLKDRHGLFDLMITVVLSGKGYFRVHNENSQIIISNRMMDEIIILAKQRIQIHSLHTDHSLENISDEQWMNQMCIYSGEMQRLFLSFCDKALAKYSSDIRFSSIRFYRVKFRGVHIEVEIPNTLNDDNIRN
jgi:hypothetical protein